MMKTKYIGYIFIFVFNVLVPHLQTEYSYLCGNISSPLKCHQNGTIDISYVNLHLWQSRCTTATDTNCIFETIKRKCNTKKKCTWYENDFKLCHKQPRRVSITFSCTRRSVFGSYTYNKKVDVCGSLSAINCHQHYVISRIYFQWNNFEHICEVQNDVSNCMKNILRLCLGHRSCGHMSENGEMCFYLPLSAHITYSCNIEGTGSSTTTTEKNTRNHSYIQTTEVSPITYVFDITKPPNTGELEWVLDIDSDFRLLIINKKGNTTYSLCANKWKNVYASFVCRHLNISDNGIAGITSRNVNLSRISYGVDCLVNITDPFECNPDYSNHSRDICDSIGDASVKCYNHTENYVSDKTGLTGIIVGGILGFVFALIFIVVFIFCRRKKKKKENKRAGDEKRENASAYSKPWNMNSQSATANYHRENDMHDTGEQERVSLIIPTPQEAATQLDGGQYFVLDPGATGFNRSTKNYSDKDNENAYATSSDGVYDVTNERRHIEKDEINIYSHTVDDVYDTSALDRKGKERDNAYDDCVIQNHYDG